MTVIADGPEEALAGTIVFRVEMSGSPHPGLDDAEPQPSQTVIGCQLLLSGPPGSHWRVATTTRDGRFAAEDVVISIPTEQGRAVVARVQLLRTYTVWGTIRGPDGKPVGGAQLTAAHCTKSCPPPTTSSADGTYRIAVLGEFILRARAPGYSSASQEVTEPAIGQDERIDLTLGAPWDLTGIAIDRYGMPLAGKLRVSVAAGGNECSIDTCGRFRFEDLQREVTDVRLCWSTGEAVEGEWVRLPEEKGDHVDVGTVVFDVKRKVEVEVVNEAGTRLDGVPLAVSSAGVDGSHLFAAEIWLGSGHHTIRALGIDASATVDIGPGPLASPVVLVAKGAVQMRGRVVYVGTEKPDLSGLKYIIEGPARIASRDASARGEYLPAPIGSEFEDSGTFNGHSITFDGEFSFCVPSAWPEALVVVGPPAYGTLHRTLAWEIVASRSRPGDGPIEIRITPKDAMGFRLSLSDSEGSSVSVRDVTLEGPRETIGVMPLGRDATQWVYFPIHPGLWTIRAVTTDGKIRVLADAAIEGHEWPTFTLERTR